MARRSGRSASGRRTRASRCSRMNVHASPWLRTKRCRTASAVSVPSVPTCSAKPEQGRRVAENPRPRSGSVRPRSPGCVARLQPAVELEHACARRWRSMCCSARPETAHLARVDIGVHRPATARSRKADRAAARRSGSPPRAAWRRSQQRGEIGRGCSAVHEADTRARGARGRRRRAGGARPPGPPRPPSGSEIGAAARRCDNSTATRGSR